MIKTHLISILFIIHILDNYQLKTLRIYTSISNFNQALSPIGLEFSNSKAGGYLVMFASSSKHLMSVNSSERVRHSVPRILHPRNRLTIPM